MVFEIIHPEVAIRPIIWQEEIMSVLSQEDICKFYKSIDADQEEAKVSAILSSTFGGHYCNLDHNHKEDDFDLTSKNRDFAVEVTSVISKASLDYIKYEDALTQGKEADKEKGPIAVYDDDESILGYLGEGRSFYYAGIRKAIRKKSSIAIRRIQKEPTFKRVELAIVLPCCVLFDSIDSLMDLQSIIPTFKTPFSKIFLIAGTKLFVFDKSKGEKTPPRMFTISTNE